MERGRTVESTTSHAIITPKSSPEKMRDVMPEGAPSPTPTEIINVDSRVVACDGGDGALGHPRVFLYIEDHHVMCPYCSRLYVLNKGAQAARGH